MRASPSVLVVDDDRFIRQLIATTLEDVAGARVVEAADGLEALDAAARWHPAIVFLDVEMPRLDGVETCRRLRRDGLAPGATIVMLTGAGLDVEDAARGAGADRFLSKPFSPLDLLRMVDELA